MKKVLILMIPSFFVGAYTAFVVMCMWNWFAVPALNLPNISYFNMLGLIWLIGLLTAKQSSDELKWKTLLTTIDYCVPDNKREVVLEAIKDLQDNVWIDLVAQISGQLIGNTLTLILGFILHSFVV